MIFPNQQWMGFILIVVAFFGLMVFGVKRERRSMNIIGIIPFLWIILGISILIGGALIVSYGVSLAWPPIRIETTSAAHPIIEPPKQPTAEEIAAAVAKMMPTQPNKPEDKKEPLQKEPTFKEMPGPFIVTFGNNRAVIPANATKENPTRIITVGDTEILYAYLENGKLYVNTMLYSGSGIPPVEIKHNEFIVRPLQWDRNYDETALEIVDEKLQPRLQLVYKNPRNVVIYGIFTWPNGLILMDESGMMINPNPPLAPKFRRIFKYPSRLYQGQELDKPNL